MANVTQLPNTCSAYYLSKISPMDDIKKVISDHMAADHKANPFDKHTCCYFAAVVESGCISALQKAGFKKFGGYHSHRHARKVHFMMFRPTSKLEWADGVARFPRRKRG